MEEKKWILYTCPSCSSVTSKPIEDPAPFCARHEGVVLMMAIPFIDHVQEWTPAEIAEANEQLECKLCICNLEQGRLSALQPFEIAQVKKFLTMRQLYESGWPEYSQIREQH